MTPGDAAQCEAPLLDVRPEAQFLNGHAPGAASIALEDLGRRTHELPPADHPLRVTDADAARAKSAADFLRRRGHPVVVIPCDLLNSRETGPSRQRLWRANPFLIESLALIHPVGVPTGLRALDIACGTGRDAVHLALLGYEVLGVDVLPDALDRAADLAHRNGVRIAVQVMDVESGPALPAGTFDLVSVFRFLHRPLLPLLRQAVTPGGYIVYETFHEQNGSSGCRPNNPAHLLASGELAAAFDGFEVLICRDAIERGGRYFSSLLARRMHD